MTRGAKITICILSAIIVLLVSLIAGYLYLSYHPWIRLSASGSSANIDVYHSEIIMTAYTYAVPVAISVRDEFERYHIWNETTVSGLYEYMSNEPYDIRAYGELSNGVVKLWYKGVVTDADGNTIDYYSEGSFKLPVKAKNFKLKSE